MHIFYAPFEVRYGRTYQPEIRGEGEKAARAAVAIPLNPDVHRQPVEVTYAAGSDHVESVVVSYAVEGEVDSLRDVEAAYVVVTGTRSDKKLVPVTLSHTEFVSGEAGRWKIELPLKQIHHALQDTIRKLTNGEASSNRLNRSRSFLRILVLNEEWQVPEGAFVADVLVEPGMLSNVQGGLGFVGGGYRKQKGLVLPDTVLDAVGFTTSPPQVRMNAPPSCSLYASTVRCFNVR